MSIVAENYDLIHIFAFLIQLEKTNKQKLFPSVKFSKIYFILYEEYFYGKENFCSLATLIYVIKKFLYRRKSMLRSIELFRFKCH